MDHRIFLFLISGSIFVLYPCAAQPFPMSETSLSEGTAAFTNSTSDLSRVNITMLRIGSVFSFPEYFLEIHGDGKVIYRGYKNVAVTGERISEISETETRKLIDEIIRIGYFDLEQSYTGGPSDLPAVKTHITIEDMSNSVYDYLGSRAPEELRVLYEMIDNITGAKSWVLQAPATIR